jgi:endonuclease YncB( thermonuclease family)
LGRNLKFRRRHLPRFPKPIKKTRRRIVERLLIVMIAVSLAGAFLPSVIDKNFFTGNIGSGTGNARIIDGDTIHIGTRKIRLSGIDAPESKQKCTKKDGRSYGCGNSSRQHLSKLIGGATVRCTGDKKDRYGRTIGTCYVGETDLNAAMVESGWAVAYRKYSRFYVPEEDSARLNGLGMWQGEFINPWDWRRKNRK